MSAAESGDAGLPAGSSPNKQANAVRWLRFVRVLPVLVIDDADHAIPLAEALASGGMPIAEVTFRTAAAAEAIRRIAQARPDVLAGAGTVLSTTQVDQAVDAGAQFIVSPGLNPVVVEYCLKRDIPVFPGVCTPTEIEQARSLGLRTVKFFPAEVMGGAKFIEAIASVYRDLEFIPTGGIKRDMLPQYFRTGRVLACGGSWMAPSGWLTAGEFDKVRDEAARTIADLPTIPG
jgi:2-dehydro-3-deoxyphosphogluconate aldolase/(4S)-4-hydroxy-2-oxoglutarate aldolase